MRTEGESESLSGPLALTSQARVMQRREEASRLSDSMLVSMKAHGQPSLLDVTVS